MFSSSDIPNQCYRKLISRLFNALQYHDVLNRRSQNQMLKARVDEKGMGPLERGRGRYQRKEYDLALQAFSQVRSFITHLWCCIEFHTPFSLRGH